MKYFTYLFFLLFFLLVPSLVRADDPEKNLDGPNYPLSEKTNELTTLTADLNTVKGQKMEAEESERLFKKVRQDLFRDMTDTTIPDWFVYVGEKNGEKRVTAQSLVGGDVEIRGEKYPYIKGKKYAYVVLIWKNEQTPVTVLGSNYSVPVSFKGDLTAAVLAPNGTVTYAAPKVTLNGTTPMSFKATKEKGGSIQLIFANPNTDSKSNLGPVSVIHSLKGDDIDTDRDIYVSITSLKQSVTAGQNAVGLAVSALTKLSPSSDGSPDIYSPSRLNPVRVDIELEKDDKVSYYVATARVNFNANSENRIIIHFPPNMIKQGFPNFIQTKFGAKEGTHWGASVAFGLAVDACPFTPAPEKDCFQRIQGVQANFILHYFPFEQNPFRNSVFGRLFSENHYLDLNSLNLFLGTPIVGTSNLLQTIYAGVGIGDLFYKDFGLVCGYGWDFTKNRTPNLFMGIDVKI